MYLHDTPPYEATALLYQCFGVVPVFEVNFY